MNTASIKRAAGSSVRSTWGCTFGTRRPSAPGQHLLVDRGVVGSIIEAAGIVPGDRVIEIGPGAGALTGDILLSNPQSLRAIELGTDMIRRLKLSVRDDPRLEVVQGSALDPAINLDLQNTDIILGNLPYSISTPFLRRLVLNEGPASWRTAIFLVQDEFAQKVAAAPRPLDGSGKKRGTNVRGGVGPGGLRSGSTKPYGHLAVLCGAIADVETLGPLVLGSSFDPAPAVNSRLLQLKRRPNPLLSGAALPQWYNFVRLCFGAKRQTIRSNLLSSGVLRRLDADKKQEATLRDVLSSVSFDARARARSTEVSPRDFAELFCALADGGVSFPSTSDPAPRRQN